MTCLNILLAKLSGVKSTRNGWLAKCPCHDDREPSLSISLGADGRILLKCFAGCSVEQIVRALGLEMRDLFPQRAQQRSRQERVTSVRKYEIRDPSGNLVAIHKRIELADGSKQFHWLKPDGSFSNGTIKPIELPLYGVHELNAKGFVVVAEGEKARDALASVGVPAVGTVCGAASTPCDGALKPLLDVEIVYLWPDADEPGRAHMQRIAQRLRALGHRDIRVITWPEAPNGGDAADLIAYAESSEQAREAIGELLEQAQSWQPPQAANYDDLVRTFRKWLALPSEMPLRFVLSCVIANRMAGDPLWAFIVGPSGDGKTELVNPLTGLDFVKPIDTLTTNTFLSGKQKSDPNASLLMRLPHGAILLMRDFTSVLEMHREKRDEIFAQLRKIYDGHLTRATGEGGESAELSWTGKVGLIACVTPAIEGYRAFATTLGERFLYYYLPTADRITVAQAARRNRASLHKMRDELQKAVRRFFEGLQIPETVEVPEEIGDWIVHAADFVSIARTGVERDWYSADKEITEIPDPEVPTRLSQQLDLITCAHAVLMGRDWVEPEDLELTRQVALACIPSQRRMILSLLASSEGEFTTTEVANALDLPRNTVARYLEDLCVLRLLSRRGGDGEAYIWSATDFARRGWRLLTSADTCGKVQNVVQDAEKGALLQKSGYEYTNTHIESPQSLCLGGDVCGKAPKSSSGTESLTLPRVSDDDEDDEIPF